MKNRMTFWVKVIPVSEFTGFFGDLNAMNEACSPFQSRKRKSAGIGKAIEDFFIFRKLEDLFSHFALIEIDQLDLGLG